MATIVEAFSGTETVTNSEWSLTTDTAGPDLSTAEGEYQIIIDLSALAVGDEFEWAMYEKVLSGGTQRKTATARFTGVQGVPNWISRTFRLLNGWDMTLNKITGTDRSISWSIRAASHATLATASALSTAQTSLTTIDGKLPALVGGRVDASVGAMAANVITAAATDPDFTVEVTAGLALSTQVDSVEGSLSTLATSVADLPTNAELATALSPIALSTQVDSVEGSLATLATSVDALPTNAELATAISGVPDAVWDEALAGHAIAGSAGEALTDAGTGGSAPSAADIADAVWDEALAGHAGVGAAGTALTSAGSGGAAPSAATIADAVWDEARSGHVTSGTFGEGVASVQGAVTSVTGLTTGTIATAVDVTLTASHGSGTWGGAAVEDVVEALLEAVVTDYSSVAGSVAEAIMLTKGLSLCNYVLDNCTYDSQGLLLSSRVRIFEDASGTSSASMGGSGEGELATFTLSVVTSSPGRPIITKVIKS